MKILLNVGKMIMLKGFGMCLVLKTEQTVGIREKYFLFVFKEDNYELFKYTDTTEQFQLLLLLSMKKRGRKKLVLIQKYIRVNTKI